MNIIDKIKKFFAPKPKLLPSGQSEEHYSNRQERKSFDEEIKFTPPPVNTLDFAIDQYLAAMLYQQSTLGKMDSYKAVTSLNSIASTPTDLSKSQEASLISAIEGNKNFHLYKQENKQKGIVSFYHILKGDAKSGNYRLYLNCNGTNVPVLASKFIKAMQNMPEYYFKINSQDQSAVSRRTEQFVFYVKDEMQLSQIMGKIQLVRAQYPQLFEGCHNINPFLKSFDNYICYAPDVTSKTFVDLAGTPHSIDQSFNTLLSNALENSLLNCLHLGSLDESSEGLRNIYENDIAKKQLISNIKVDLSNLAKLNPELQIKGVDEVVAQRSAEQSR